MTTTKTTPAARGASDPAVLLPRIESRIVVVRQHKVVVDTDLALLYGAKAKSLSEAGDHSVLIAQPCRPDAGRA